MSGTSSPCKMHGGHGHQHGPHGSHQPHGHHWQNVIPQDDSVMSSQPDFPHMDDCSNWDIVKATQHGILQRCKELVEAGYDVRQPDKENVTLLHWAAINNRLELVKYYISKGAVVDQLGGDLNSTPLHWAIRQGHLQVIILLLQYGADPTLIDGEGYSGIHLAVLFQHIPVIAYFISKGQSIDTPDLHGRTPLMLAAKQIIGPEPTGFLLKFHPSLNAVDKVHRNSALHWAVLSANVNAVDLLLEAGSSFEIQNNKGETPLDIANQTRNRIITHMLSVSESNKSSRSFRLLKKLEKYELFLLLLISLFLMWSVGFILDMESDSWLLKGGLFTALAIGTQLLARHFVGYKSQQHLPTAFFVSSIFWIFMTWFILFLPDLAEVGFQIPFILSNILLLYLFYKTWRTDPGFIKTSEEETKRTIVTLAEAGCLDFRMFCTSCLVKKPLRSVHCHNCNSCVARYDQHCIWTGRCIGAGNHHNFFLFLIFLSMVCGWMVFATCVYWKRHCETSFDKDGLWIFITQIVSCSPWVLYIFIIVIFHFFWSTLMLILQFYQIVFLGLTTQERINVHIQSRRAKFPVSLRKTPFNQGCLQNIADFFQCRCFGLLKPNVVDWTRQYTMIIDPSQHSHFQTV
ncbi:palmitoyltransferase ZDHHC13 [Pleurodeles waltl]|uniref:palmitoyltransferase ZDHHC13 n=1 Tax=Pleurodeles waltl TaxID=8319 RepID=UPI0037098DAE